MLLGIFLELKISTLSFFPFYISAITIHLNKKIDESPRTSYVGLKRIFDAAISIYVVILTQHTGSFRPNP